MKIMHLSKNGRYVGAVTNRTELHAFMKNYQFSVLSLRCNDYNYRAVYNSYHGTLKIESTLFNEVSA